MKDCEGIAQNAASLSNLGFSITTEDLIDGLWITHTILVNLLMMTV
jgi:hypothetical protein